MHKAAVLVALALITAGCGKDQAPSASVAAASAPTSGVNLTYVDKSVAPGDDFDAYANGAWRKSAVIPPDRATIGVGFEVFQKAEQRTADLVKSAAEAKPAAGTDARRVADYYAAYMDTAGIEARGLSPVKPRLDEIAAIGDRTALSRRLGASVRADTDPLNNTNFATENLFGVFVTQGLNEPNRTMPYLMQGGLGLPERDYYLSKDAEMAKIREGYRTYLGDMLALMGRPDAKAAADRILVLETKIARAHASIQDSQDIHKANNTWARTDFARKAPGIDWSAFFQGARLETQPDLMVWQPGAVTGLSALVASEPLETWKDWLAFHLVNQYASVLPKAFDDRNFAFYGRTLSGTPQQLPREKRALAAVSGGLGDAVGKMYADRYFPASAKADVQLMVKNILAAFDKRVADLAWMTPATKAEARRKIQTLRVGVGYPETWRDYAALEIRPDDPFGNAWRAGLYEYGHQLSKIGKPIDRGEWWMTPQTVNAVNLPLQNALNFPAAILEAPFYDPKADAAANYGSIGSVIGHEISHSFDNLGAEFDAEGRLRNWWTSADLAQFKRAGQALVAQYDAYEPLPGLHLKGAQTQGENTADVAGLAAALDAYHASLAGKPAPVIDGLSGDQRFFLAFAQGWRKKVRDEALRQQILTNEHAPDAQRVQTVRNLDAWYPAFDVKPGQKLYLSEKDRVRIW
jgi:putative endopeptidase